MFVIRYSCPVFLSLPALYPSIMSFTVYPSYNVLIKSFASYVTTQLWSKSFIAQLKPSCSASSPTTSGLGPRCCQVVRVTFFSLRLIFCMPWNFNVFGIRSLEKAKHEHRADLLTESFILGAIKKPLTSSKALIAMLSGFFSRNAFSPILFLFQVCNGCMLDLRGWSSILSSELFSNYYEQFLA